MVEPPARADQLAHAVIGAALTVHRTLGPGFGERIYENALCVEMGRRGIPHERQVRVPVAYQCEEVGEYVLDVVVGALLVVELKAIETLGPIHVAQLRSYLRATQMPLGLLVNFNVQLLRNGLKRVVLSRTLATSHPKILGVTLASLAPWRSLGGTSNARVTSPACQVSL